MCVFDSRAGAHARALFPTRQQAVEFAERHARVTAPPGTPLRWEDAGHRSVLSTPVGDFLIAPLHDGDAAKGHVA